MGKTFSVDEPTVHEVKVGEVTYKTRPNTIALQIELEEMLDKRQNLRVQLMARNVRLKRIDGMDPASLPDDADSDAEASLRSIAQLVDEFAAVTLEIAQRVITGPDGKPITPDVLHQFPRPMVAEIVDAVFEDDGEDPTPGQAASN